MHRGPQNLGENLASALSQGNERPSTRTLRFPALSFHLSGHAGTCGLLDLNGAIACGQMAVRAKSRKTSAGSPQTIECEAGTNVHSEYAHVNRHAIVTLNRID